MSALLYGCIVSGKEPAQIPKCQCNTQLYSAIRKQISNGARDGESTHSMQTANDMSAIDTQQTTKVSTSTYCIQESQLASTAGFAYPNISYEPGSEFLLGGDRIVS